MILEDFLKVFEEGYIRNRHFEIDSYIFELYSNEYEIFWTLHIYRAN